MKSIKKGVRSPEKTAKLIKLFDIKEAVTEYLQGTISVSDTGVLRYKSEVIDNVLTHKILDMMNQGFEVEPMLNFLVNLRDNPSKAAQDELMLFMEINGMPITTDGHFLAYKSVRDNYMDHHTGKHSNHIGAVLSMPRLDVCDNRAITCASGYHGASLSYASSFGGSGHLMVIKISPKDVVSIPNDYKNQKLRCCRYAVIDEVPKNMDDDKYTHKAVWEDEDYNYCTCFNCGAEIDCADEICLECGEHQ